MEFEVWVSVDATNYGQSQWSESLYFETTSTESNATEIATLISEIVRANFKMCLFFLKKNQNNLSISCSGF